jgi:hypothetical protein
MKGLLVILASAFSKIPTLQYSKTASCNFACVLDDLRSLYSEILMTSKGWNGAL